MQKEPPEADAYRGAHALGMTFEDTRDVFAILEARGIERQRRCDCIMSMLTLFLESAGEDSPFFVGGKFIGIKDAGRVLSENVSLEYMEHHRHRIGAVAAAVLAEDYGLLIEPGWEDPEPLC